MRYAIYFTPGQDDPLARIAAGWLGRNPFTDTVPQAPVVTALSPAEIAYHTASARRYGFHATLKAPFVLAEGKTEAELDARIEEARAQARASDRLVLLDFVADWCEDCREVVRLSKRHPARSVIEERYVVVYVEVGRFDRHRAWIERFGIDRIATLVILDPESGERVAQTTLEPITGGQRGLTSAQLAQWYRDPS